MLNRNFLHTETELFRISKSRLVMGLFAGLFFAFCFYALLYLTRESFRILSITDDYDIWILTDKQVSFYNLIFALISVIFAQSICFTFWFDRPLKLLSKRKFQRKAIVNDQRGLNTIFLFWFSKLAVIFGLIFGLTYQGGFYAFSLYPNYNNIFVLIVLVLFLHTWITIRRTDKKHSLKWMFISLFIVSTIAYGLSKVNLIDYNEINNIALQKNIPYKYNLELPESNCFETKSEARYLTKHIYVVRNKQNENSVPQIFVDNQEVNLKNLDLKISEFQSSINESDIYMCTYHLHIDKTIKMKFVNELKKELASSNAFSIAYAIVPTNAKYDKRFYKDYSFRVRLPKYDFENFEELKKYQNIIEVMNTDSGEYMINEISYSVEDLKQVIKEKIESNTNYIVKFHVNDNVNFSVYFNVISKTKEAVNELRNDYALKTYSKAFENLNTDEMHETVDKYAFRIFEITTEMKKLISLEK